MKERNLKGLLLSIALVEVLGALSGWLAGNSSGIYMILNKPPLSPPGWLFGVAWPVLYALMGAAAYLIHTADAPPKERNEALQLFNWQLLVNLLWPVFFFRCELFWAAIVVIVILDVLVFLMIRVFRKLDKIAAMLLVPYLIWILFATYLNMGIALLNV